MILRWNIGDAENAEIKPAGLDLLSRAVDASLTAFPVAKRRVVCVSRSSPKTIKAVNSAVAGHAEVIIDNDLPPAWNAADVSPLGRNAMYKFVPPRVDIKEHELSMDNDVVLWREPPAVLAWRNSSDLLVSGWRMPTGTRRKFPSGSGVELPFGHEAPSYGNVDVDIKAIDSQLALNTGIVGWPPGLSPLSLFVPNVSLRAFCAEQGVFVLSVLRQKIPYQILPYVEVPTINKHTWCAPRGDSLATLEQFFGAHFSSTNFGENPNWCKYYEAYVCRGLLW